MCSYKNTFHDQYCSSEWQSEPVLLPLSKETKKSSDWKTKKNTVRAGTDDIEIQLPQFESKIIYERFFFVREN